MPSKRRDERRQKENMRQDQMKKRWNETAYDRGMRWDETTCSKINKLTFLQVRVVQVWRVPDTIFWFKNPHVNQRQETSGRDLAGVQEWVKNMIFQQTLKYSMLSMPNMWQKTKYCLFRRQWKSVWYACNSLGSTFCFLTMKCSPFLSLSHTHTPMSWGFLLQHVKMLTSKSWFCQLW